MRIFSIFKSISGELGLFYPGSPTIFIRFAGCPLHCTWCDTLPAIPRESGEEISLDEVMGRVQELSGAGQIRQVLITGGEPLWQREAFEELVSKLRAFDVFDRPHYTVQVETSGVCLPSKKARVLVDWWVVDCKLESSGEATKMKFAEFGQFAPRFSIKFPIADRVDFDAMLRICDMNTLVMDDVQQILLSPVSPLAAGQLLQWQSEAAQSRPWLQRAMLNVQLHKLVALKEDQ